MKSVTTALVLDSLWCESERRQFSFDKAVTDSTCNIQ